MPKTKQLKLKINDDLLVTARIGASPPKMESPKVRKWNEVMQAVNGLQMIKGTSPWMELKGFPTTQEMMHCKNQLAVHLSKGKLKRSTSFKLKMTYRYNQSEGYSLWVRKEKRKRTA